MATWENVIAATNDDGYTEVDYWNATMGPVFGNSGAAAMSGGVRWTNITVPAGATINSATLRLRAERDSAAATSVHAIIYGDDVDDAPAWAADTSSVNDIVETTAHVHVDPSAWTANAYYSYDITAIVAELVARAGWASGQAMRFGIKDNGSSSGIYCRSYDYADGGGADYNARLTIDYTEAAAITPQSATETYASALAEQQALAASGSPSDAPLATVVAESVGWAAYQNARPDADVADGGWLNEAASNTNLHLSVGEGIPNLATYIRSSTDPVNDTCTFGLTDIANPADGEILIRVIARWVE